MLAGQSTGFDGPLEQLADTNAEIDQQPGNTSTRIFLCTRSTLKGPADSTLL
jgi:hypothetical protein